jgi:hypothetical protein
MVKDDAVNISNINNINKELWIIYYTVQNNLLYSSE